MMPEPEAQTPGLGEAEAELMREREVVVVELMPELGVALQEAPMPEPLTPPRVMAMWPRTRIKQIPWGLPQVVQVLIR